MREIIQYAAAFALLCLLFAVATYDVFASWQWGHEYTISALLQSWAKRFPMVSLGFGVVIGHLFWPVSLADKTTHK